MKIRPQLLDELLKDTGLRDTGMKHPGKAGEKQSNWYEFKALNP